MADAMMIHGVLLLSSAPAFAPVVFARGGEYFLQKNHQGRIATFTPLHEGDVAELHSARLQNVRYEPWPDIPVTPDQPTLFAFCPDASFCILGSREEMQDYIRRYRSSGETNPVLDYEFATFLEESEEVVAHAHALMMRFLRGRGLAQAR